MRKFSVLFLASVSFILLLSTGCASTMATSTASEMSRIKAEPMGIWTRPFEMGFTIIGMGEGSAQTNDVKIVDSAPSFFLSGSVPENTMSPMVKLAAFNAIQKANADGMYITMAKEEGSGSFKKAWVKGILLRLGVYGAVSIERTDAERLCKCNDHKKPCSLKTSLTPTVTETKTEKEVTAEQ
ncbi:MAG TPA: hypothetical protein PLZ43_13535 [bacterium]|nr:hypothetical protein [bacterium]